MEKKRLLSLDVLRGATVCLMILVNNGAGKHIYATLQHSKWNGMTPCDLVFPFFLFIMGISTYLSLKKTNFTWSRQVAFKIVKRTVLLFLIGLFINWFDMAISGNALASLYATLQSAFSHFAAIIAIRFLPLLYCLQPTACCLSGEMATRMTASKTFLHKLISVFSA